MQLFDTHFHLKDDDCPQTIINNAREAGVNYMTAIGTNTASSEHVLQVANRFDGVFCSAGVHPLDIDDFADDYKPFQEFWQEEKCVAVGEIGLDYYYSKENDVLQRQRKIFTRFLEYAGELALPPVIHCRDAFDDCYKILKDVLQGKQPFILHCYTGDREWAEKIIDLGAYISYSGIVTFKNAQQIRESLKIVPQDRILVETDSPYLAPVPYRGKTNQPAYVGKVLEGVADELAMNVAKAATMTTANAKRVFKIED